MPYHEPFVLFGFLGAVTERVELVTSILILPQRQTVLVAKQAAELDLLTGGRLRLGVGVGRNWMEYEALNEDFTNRGARIEEQVEVLRRLWTEELVTFDGTVAPPRPHRAQPDAGAAAHPDLDGLVRRPGRREGDPAHRPPGRRLVPAVRRRPDLAGGLRGCGATPPRPAATRPSIGIECGIAVKARRRPGQLGRAGRGLPGAGRDAPAGDDRGRRLRDTPQEHLDAALRWLAAVNRRTELRGLAVPNTRSDGTDGPPFSVGFARPPQPAWRRRRRCPR